MAGLHPIEAIPASVANGSCGARQCEKTIAANHWAIYCRCAGLRHCEHFGCTILRAIGLLVFIRVVTFHTASGTKTRSSGEGCAAGVGLVKMVYGGGRGSHLDDECASPFSDDSRLRSGDLDH